MSGLYVACWLDPATAAQFAVEQGESADSLHITLAYLGEEEQLPDGARDLAQQVCGQLAFQQRPLAGVSAGFGVFRSGGEQDCFWAAVDVPGLVELRQNLCDALCTAGLEPDETHGFTPHITLAYLPAGSPVMIGPTEPLPLELRSVAVVSPDSDTRTDLPFLGVYIAKEQPAASDVHVDTPLAARRRKRKPPVDGAAVTVIKADDDRQIVCGIVLQPGVADSQEDVVSKEDIELAAHRFLYNRTPIGLQHLVLAPDDVRPVESYLAPVDFTIETPRGPELVLKGSWIVAAHVPDQKLWQLAKSEGFTGWSIAGTGKRSPLPA